MSSAVKGCYGYKKFALESGKVVDVSDRKELVTVNRSGGGGGNKLRVMAAGAESQVSHLGRYDGEEKGKEHLKIVLQ